MKGIFYIILAIGVLACSNTNTKTKALVSSEPCDSIVPSPIKDTLASEPIVVDSIPSDAQLSIYPFYKIQIGDTFKTGFVPLSDSYSWSESPDSQLVENQYLGVSDYDNYHPLKGEYRSRFLARSGISEADHIYTYSVELDSLKTYNVKDLAIVAFISPYGIQSTASQYDYQVGFEIKDLDLPGGYFLSTLVYVGPANPFSKGKLVAMQWEKTETDNFPDVKLKERDSLLLARHPKPTETFVFKNKDYEFYVQNIGNDERFGPAARHLVIQSARAKKLIKSRIYSDSEGSYLKPLNGVNKAYKGAALQWTGKLFKNKPPVFFGFLGVSFGCPTIQFVDEVEGDVWVKCDNRH